MNIIYKLIPAALLATLAACEGAGWNSYDSGYSNPYYGSSSSSSSGYGSKGRSSSGGSSGEDVISTFDPSCVDETGFDGRGCFTCAPKTNEEFLNACTKSRFETFENAEHIAGYVPSDPRPALYDQGATPPAYASGTKDPTDVLPPAPACPIATKPNPVVIVGATGFPMETLARAMGTQATLFYLEKSSCDGVASVLLGSQVSGEIAYYDADGTRNRCTLTEPRTADIGLSSLFAETCAGESGLANPVVLPGDIKDYVGPASTVMFAVPATSKERAISAEAAYRVYGFGSASGVAPWTDEQFVFRRTPSSGNQTTVGLSLGLPLDKFRGRDSSGSSNMLNALRDSKSAAKTLGISSGEIVDVNRDVLKSLAYKHYAQTVAFYPDSDPGQLDRRNVRDGHYFLWLPLHVVVRTNRGEPVAVDAAHDAAVKRLTYVMTSRQEPPVPTVDLLGAFKRTGNVPACAMHVQRVREAAPLEPVTPVAPCDCAFEAASPGSTSKECQACDSSSDCPSNRPVCSFGYCEGK